MIGGYRPAGSNGIDALLVGYYDETGLRFAGKVRAGFVPHLRREVFKALKPHHAGECPFVDLPIRMEVPRGRAQAPGTSRSTRTLRGHQLLKASQSEPKPSIASA